MKISQAVSHINRQSVLLVFPLDNRPEFPSIWSQFFPRTKMRWEWDEAGDNRVAELWHLRSELAVSKKAVYAKWFRGRATYFSHAAFPAFLRLKNLKTKPTDGLSRTALELLQILELDSPLSTKELRKASGLQGRLQEKAYTKGMKELWDRLLIVGTGEKDDGAFPSLMMATTQHWFEDLWQEAFQMSAADAAARLKEVGLKSDSPFLKPLASGIDLSSL